MAILGTKAETVIKTILQSMELPPKGINPAMRMLRRGKPFHYRDMVLKIDGDLLHVIACGSPLDSFSVPI